MVRISAHGSAKRSPGRSAGARRLRWELLESRILLSALIATDSLPLAGPEVAAPGPASADLMDTAELEPRAAGLARLQSAALPHVEKLVVAGDPFGAPPDTPSDRVDANSTASPFAGVGSLAISLDPFLFICTGTAVSPTHVLTAAHCLDLDDDGAIDVAPEDVQFNLNFGSNRSHTLTGAALFVHPDWTGFANPSINDDVAVVELASALPAGVPIYPLHTDPFVAAETVTMVGYGRSGDGVSGYFVSPSFSVKRTGANLTDFYDLDDEGSGAREIFQFDFDGNGFDFSFTPGLGNDIETTLGGGDSGGPAFIDKGGVLEVFGINTHGFDFLNPMPLFGSGAGGIVVAPYADWIRSIIESDPGPATPLVLETGTVADVGNDGWTTVTLRNTYTSMVVVASPNYDASGPAGVVRIRNASGSSFEVRVDSTVGPAISGVAVNYLVVEEGEYNAADHGITMEAVKFASTDTDSKNSWTGQLRSYGNTYGNPVVLGQVMSYNDPDYSLFWAAGSTRNDPPSASMLRVGKHVGEDPDTTRAAEIVGYVVVEAGSGTLSDGREFFAANGADVVRGMDNAPPYEYSLPGLAFEPVAAIATLAGMDGGDGGWAVLYGVGPVSSSTLRLAVDEDQNDGERGHTTEQVAYLLLGPAPGPAPGVTVTPTSGLETTEGGGTAEFNVVLNSQPLANVTVGISSSDATEGTVSAANVTFTPANWNVPQTITVTGVDDALDDGDVAYSVMTAPAASADAFYNGFDADDVALVNLDNDASVPLTLESGLVAGVTNVSWTTVTLENTYTSMVVVAAVNELPGMPPLVARIQNAMDGSFDIRVDRVDGSADPVSAVQVYYFVVEEGIYTAAEDGITMEAVKFTSTVTDRRYSWVGEIRSYANTYSNPVVLGQVMTYNDTDFSVFWSAGATRQDPPSSSVLRLGKHVGEDPDSARLDETIGYIVVETGTGAIGSLQYTAGVGADLVTGVDDAPPTPYPFDPLVPSGGVVSQAGMDGGNGGWAVLYATDPYLFGEVRLAIEEDQIADAERNHTSEQVAYLIFGTPDPSDAPLITSVALGGGDAEIMAALPLRAPDCDQQHTDFEESGQSVADPTYEASANIGSTVRPGFPAVPRHGNALSDAETIDRAVAELSVADLETGLLEQLALDIGQLV